MRLLGLSLAWCVVACGGQTKTEERGVVGTGATPGDLTDGGGASGAGGGIGGTGGLPADGGGTPYRDPGCPTETKQPGFVECDVAESAATCSPGYHCVPTVTYGEKCHTEEIGTRCVPAGTATQGDDCTNADCAAGYVCVTGGTGFVCAKLCFSQTDCPAGLLCSALDVDGYGVCG
ncbi:MAG TPA: hypothetical protein VHE30_29835 [Polyangiaceae bacterium]|nr:hypothetical protein [Polyangiaceae bacterium]